MTGLEPDVDELVEIAVIVTDTDLRPLAEGIDLVIKPSAESLTQMSQFVVQMHTDSGLILEFESGMALEEAEEIILSYLMRLVPQAGIAPVAGNSIAQDVRFLRAYMPRVVAYLHYRTIDVSTIKELAKRWYPRVYACAPEKTGGHRALGDIQDSIMELQYYREALFPAELNPVKGTYRQLAEKVAAQGPGVFDGDAGWERA